MSATSLSRPAPVVEPEPLPSPREPAGDPPTAFPPCAELGEQLRHLQEAQAEIDRRQAEELARLREIQNRD
jgi:hypothetical protein